MWSWKGRSWCFLSTFHHLLWTPKYSLSSSLHFKHCSIYSGRKQMIWLLLCYSFDPWVTFNLSVWSVFLSLSLIVLSVWSNLLLPGCYLFDPGARSQVTPTAWHCLTGTEQRPESLSVPALCFIGHYLAKEDLLGHTHHRVSGFNWVNLNFQMHFWIYTVYYTEAD